LSTGSQRDECEGGEQVEEKKKKREAGRLERRVLSGARDDGGNASKHFLPELGKPRNQELARTAAEEI
jgi:hypothetical protein